MTGTIVTVYADEPPKKRPSQKNVSMLPTLLRLIRDASQDVGYRPNNMILCG